MSMPLVSEDLRVTIERLRPELPTLLGRDYPTFIAQLDAFLARGSEDQVKDWLEKYPVVYERLLDTLAEQGEEEETAKGGFRLYGDPIVPVPAIRYRCKIGLHLVTLTEVEERDAVGNALCPQHHLPMVVETGSGPNQGQE